MSYQFSSPTIARCFARGSCRLPPWLQASGALSDRHPGMLRDFANEAMRRLSSDQYDMDFSPSTLSGDILRGRATSYGVR